MEYVKKRDVAVDVGGHCGIWAKELCKLFGRVHSFEPVADHRDCYARNQKTANWTLYPYALGERDGKAGYRTKLGSSGDTWLVKGTDVEVKKLDDFNLEPDLLKIDCEGYEIFVLRGGLGTLMRCKPVVIVEQKPGNGSRYGLCDTEAVTRMKRWGYELKREIHGDFVFAWPSH